MDNTPENNFNIDFEGLPQNGIRIVSQSFSEGWGFNKSDFDNWKNYFEERLFTLSDENKALCIRKGIEYAIHYKAHHKNTCKEGNECDLLPNLDKRIAFAKELLLPTQSVFEPEKQAIGISTTLDTKPVFITEKVAEIFDILKVFFSTEHQKELENILKTGDILSEPLLFLENGNRLADAFKQLYEADFIVGCQKKVLENWISKNFTFRYRNKVKSFKLRYLNDIISSNNDSCKKPILDVKKTNGVYIISKV